MNSRGSASLLLSFTLGALMLSAIAAFRLSIEQKILWLGLQRQEISGFFKSETQAWQHWAIMQETMASTTPINPVKKDDIFCGHTTVGHQHRQNHYIACFDYRRPASPEPTPAPPGDHCPICAKLAVDCSAEQERRKKWGRDWFTRNNPYLKP